MSDGPQHINTIFLCNEWKSSKGGLSTFNRELAINLAKWSNVKVHCLLLQSDCSDKEDALKNGVNLITAVPRPGLDPIDWLKFPPREVQQIDVVVGHGHLLGSAAYFIKCSTHCKWVQFVHAFSEDLGKYKATESPLRDVMKENEVKHAKDIELCKAADKVVAVGSLLQEKYQKSLPGIKVETITPGILEEFSSHLTHKLAKADVFNIFSFGRGTWEDLELEGYDLIGNAIASLGEIFELHVVGSFPGQHRATMDWFHDNSGITMNHLKIHGFCTQEELIDMLSEADLVVLPPRMEGFGLVALEAISVCVPVLVSNQSGIAKALEKVNGGNLVVINCENTRDLAEKIQQLSKQTREERLISAWHLRENYRKTYSWSSECKRFEGMIRNLVEESHSCQSISGPNKSTVGRTHLTERVAKSDSEDESDIQLTENKLLHLAAKVGDIAIIKNLLSQGFDINARDADEKTPLMIAACHGKTEAVSLLLENGADVFLKSEDGSTLQHSAALGGNVTIVEEMLNRGLDIDLTDGDDNTPLMYAAFNGRMQVVNCLLKHGADPSLKGRYGRNSLHWASSSGNIAVIETLLSCGVAVDSKDWSGKTSLMYAASLGKEEAVTYLLQTGADPLSKNNLGKNLLHFSSQGGSLFIIETMLYYGLDINSRDDDGNTPLAVADSYGKSEAVGYLLDKGACKTHRLSVE